jgi:hypothetical protein
VVGWGDVGGPKEKEGGGGGVKNVHSTLELAVCVIDCITCEMGTERSNVGVVVGDAVGATVVGGHFSFMQALMSSLRGWSRSNTHSYDSSH